MKDEDKMLREVVVKPGQDEQKAWTAFLQKLVDNLKALGGGLRREVYGLLLQTTGNGQIFEEVLEEDLEDQIKKRGPLGVIYIWQGDLTTASVMIIVTMRKGQDVVYYTFTMPVGTLILQHSMAKPHERPALRQELLRLKAYGTDIADYQQLLEDTKLVKTRL